MSWGFFQAQKKMHGIGEEVLRYWDELNFEEKDSLLKEIASLDIKAIEEAFKNFPSLDKKAFFPPQGVQHNPTDTQITLGKKLISQGKAACLLLAGGQGTRLGFSGPKGMYPVSVIKKKSLFQIFSEKVKAASKQSGVSLPLAIMTSCENHQATCAFFQENEYFGLLPSQVDFFCQKNLPLLTHNHKIFLKNKFQIAQGPDGNGYALRQVVESGIYQKWQERGVEYVFFVLVDNPLSDPFDAGLLGYHARHDKELTIKTCKREDPNESVGVLVQDGSSMRIVEYSELDTKQKEARDDRGDLLFPYANLSLFCFSMDWIQRVSKQKLPWHSAKKKASSFGEDVDCLKLESFIFDLLPFAGKVGVLNYPRFLCYSPLKNAQGMHSLDTLQRDLLAYDRHLLRFLFSRSTSEDHLIELSQDFYYPTQDFLDRMQRKKMPLEGYLF